VALRSMALKNALARRRERKASKRMALRLALLLAAVLALPFAYWQLQLHQVLYDSASTDKLEQQCLELNETVAKVRDEAGRPIGANSQALEDKRIECDEMGIETTGSIPDATPAE
jgi:hypothetical protein